MPPKLILASTSAYRAALLAQLGFEFEQLDPLYEEQSQDGENPKAKASRLAREKAISATSLLPIDTACIIIGSDQVAHFANGNTLSKPSNFEKAADQLRSCSGQWLKFSTGVCLVDNEGKVLSEGLDEYEIKYRQISDNDINSYLQADKPYDCAGSIKAEGLGIHIIEEGRGKDINTLYGLPLILLLRMLRSLGYDTFKAINNIK